MKKIIYVILIGIMIIIPKSVFALDYTVDSLEFLNNDPDNLQVWKVKSFYTTFFFDNNSASLFSKNDYASIRYTIKGNFNSNETYVFKTSFCISKHLTITNSLLNNDTSKTTYKELGDCQLATSWGNSPGTAYEFITIRTNNAPSYTEFTTLSGIINFNVPRPYQPFGFSGLSIEAYTQSEYNAAHSDELQEQIKTNEKLDDINDSLTSTEGPDLGSLENSAGWLPSGPVDSILTLPLTLMNNILTNLSKSCQPINLTLPFVKQQMSLPCISTIYSQIDGLSVWINTISYIAAAIILFHYFMNLYKWVDDTLSFRENNWNDTDQWGGV